MRISFFSSRLWFPPNYLWNTRVILSQWPPSLWLHMGLWILEKCQNPARERQLAGGRWLWLPFSCHYSCSNWNGYWVFDFQQLCFLFFVFVCLFRRKGIIVGSDQEGDDVTVLAHVSFPSLPKRADLAKSTVVQLGMWERWSAQKSGEGRQEWWLYARVIELCSNFGFNYKWDLDGKEKKKKKK